MTKLIDLSLELSSKISVFPGDPSVSIKTVSFVQKDGCNITDFHFASHLGTHIDAPLHMIDGGKNLSDFTTEKFVGEGIILDASKLKNSIDIKVLNNIKLKKDLIVLFYTNYSKRLYKKNYFENHPIITESLAQKLVKAKVKIVGIDFPSPDKEPYNVHKLLLANNILIIENLINLDKIVGKKVKIYALPLKVAVDGAPVRVFAEII